MFRQKLLLLAVAVALTGCAAPSQHNDPFERSNRFMFKVNVQFDNYILKPVAKGYLYVPSPVRQSVRNFLDNLASPVTLANDIFQLQGQRASTTALRFGINSTVGLFGLFDPAKRLGLEKHDEDLLLLNKRLQHEKNLLSRLSQQLNIKLNVDFAKDSSKIDIETLSMMTRRRILIRETKII